MHNHLSWCSEIVDSLFSCGVRHAVISPGSRSTPVTIAFASHPGIKKTVVLDERSAAFIALGIGKATGVPAVLVCTSGTAVANYFPAVVEAKESGVPMVVLSADRPPHLRGTGSSQTIDQIKIFGDHAIFFHEAGEPAFGDADIRRIRLAAKQAVSEAIETGGAAHINLPFRKPLEPSDEEIAALAKKFSSATKTVIDKTPVLEKTVKPGKELLNLINRADCPVIIAGPAEKRHAHTTLITELAERRKIPVLAEPGSRMPQNENLVTGFEQFLRKPESVKELQPDLIIRAGDQPFTKSLQLALEKWHEQPVIHFMADSRWQYSAVADELRIEVSPDDTFDLGGIEIQKSDEWLNLWKSNEKQAESSRKEFLQAENQLTDGHVFDSLSQKLDNSWNVMLSNSFPVRDMAMFGTVAPHQYVNRGAAGIDGITSTAAGLAIASGEPVCCITGDLAFLHDSNALLSLQKMPAPFPVVVINNNGGTIFRMLPVHKNKEVYQTYFETPQQAEISSIAAAFNIPYKKITTIEQLDQFDPKTLDAGAVIVECVTDADKSMEIRKKLWAGI